MKDRVTMEAIDLCEDIDMLKYRVGMLLDAVACRTFIDKKSLTYITLKNVTSYLSAVQERIDDFRCMYEAERHSAMRQKKGETDE